MDILSIGVDIEDVNRFRKLEYSENEEFYEKIFTKDEIEYCLSNADPYPHFAARFCAKEAVIKALNDSISTKEIEVIKEEKRPKVVIKGHEDFKLQVSLSHTKEYAVAFVVLME